MQDNRLKKLLDSFKVFFKKDISELHLIDPHPRPPTKFPPIKLYSLDDIHEAKYFVAWCEMSYPKKCPECGHIINGDADLLGGGCEEDDCVFCRWVSETVCPNCKKHVHCGSCL